MTDAIWFLHPRLEADTVPVGDFALSRLLLSNDANYPWLILVPRRPAIREIHELSEDDQIQLLRESGHLARAMTTAFTPVKLNVAALGNVVPQLHLHHIARYRSDPAWPDPVWGRVRAAHYDEAARQARIVRLRKLLTEVLTPIGVV